jgi:alkylation response protein AidB-like acyl-CoA dehydrogenase
MKFELSKDQKMIRKAARDFAEKEFENVREYDREERFPKDVWKKACELGFVGVTIDEKYNGMGLTPMENVLVIEEFCRVDLGMAHILSTTFGCEILQKVGTEEQKENYLAKLPTGDAIMATAITEPNAGSDVASITTRAEKDGDEYVINGSKIFITNGTIADFILVVCRTSKEEKRNEGLSLFLVDADTKGFKATKMYGKLGIRPSDTAELSFSNVRVPEENLVGQLGKGFYHLMDFFNESRLIAAAQAVGTAQGAYEKALRYARERKQFGRSIAEFQAIQFKLAEMATKIEAARWLTYRAAWHCAIGKPDPALSSMAKWYAGEVAVRVCDEALQIHGGYGYMEEYDMERFYRNAKITEIYEGTKEVQKLIIAREILRRIR